MAESTPTTERTVTVTLDLTDDDVYAVLVNSLSEAADYRAEREAQGENPNADWIEDQEQVAQIARALVANIETQIDAASTPQQENPA